jgi:NAD(P) transhydrogenase
MSSAAASCPGTGSATVEFDDRTIIDSDGIVNLERVPRSMVVAGAGATELVHIGQA